MACKGYYRPPGLRGCMLFDEFEDVLTNLRSFRQQEDAFSDLFLFFAGKRFSGKPITP